MCNCLFLHIPCAKALLQMEILSQVVAWKIEPHNIAYLSGYTSTYKSKLITANEGTIAILSMLRNEHPASGLLCALVSLCDLLNASASCMQLYTWLMLNGKHATMSSITGGHMHLHHDLMREPGVK